VAKQTLNAVVDFGHNFDVGRFIGTNLAKSIPEKGSIRDTTGVAQTAHEATRTRRSPNAERRPNGRAESADDPPTKHPEAQESAKKSPLISGGNWAYRAFP
jgi:hypothetical protein